MGEAEMKTRVRMAELAARADECRRVAARMRQRAVEGPEDWWTEMAAWMDARAAAHTQELVREQRELNTELHREVAAGDRIELVETRDPFTLLKPGDRGTVRRVVDDVVDVQWDSGSTLSLVLRAGDRFIRKE